MGFIETLAKAQKFDNMQNQQNADNAYVAEAANMKAQELAAENQYLKEGLAAMVAPRYNANPQEYESVPADKISGYTAANANYVSPGSYTYPVSQEGGLWQMLLQKAGIK